MVDWKLTATTIYCDAVDDEVTLIIYQDWSLKCTGYDRYYQPDRETGKLLKSKSKRLQRKLACEGQDCSRVVQYKNKLSAEEAVRETESQVEG